MEKRAQGEVWLDGEWLPAARATFALTDEGLLSGVGTFETLAVRKGLPVDWEAHLERLGSCAERLGVDLPDGETLAVAAQRLCAQVPAGYGFMKIVALRPGHCLLFCGTMDPAEEGRASSAVLLPWTRNPRDALAGLKTLNYAPFTLGLEEAQRRGADEGLWLNTRGHLAEGCTSSLFVVSRGRVFTPCLRDGILPGVTRGLALRAARELGLQVHEGKVRLKRLETADEAFLTSSLRAVRPLTRFEGRPVGKGQVGPVTRAVADKVAQLRVRWRPLAATSAEGSTA